ADPVNGTKTSGWAAMALLWLVLWLTVACAHVWPWERQSGAGAASPQQAQDVRTEAELRRAVADAERFGPNDPRLATSLNALAVFYASHGHPAQAEPLYRRALEIRERALGPAHPDVIASVNNLAGLYALERRFAEAEPLYRRALQINERIDGAEAA